MSLPIWAVFMRKVYGDPTLGYFETETFKIPSTYNPDEGCDGQSPPESSSSSAVEEF
jgi:penicillin-binding protein 1A